MSNNLTKQEIVHALWERGILKWKCHDVQKEMYDIYHDSPDNSIHSWLLARQSGKSYLLGILGTEKAIAIKGSIIKLLTDTKLHAETIFVPIFDQILEDCPLHLRPKYDKQKYKYVFPNGSQIQLAGSDGGHYEKLRGQKTDLILVDEAGFCTDLKDIVNSVLIPTTTHTGGKTILASTPPKDPEHDFVEFVEKCDLENTLVKKTIYDNPLLSEDQIQGIIKQFGNTNNPEFRREYLCEIIRDESTVVFPEFTKELRQRIVRNWDIPPFYNSYVSMDLGGKDMTVVLFLYYDFKYDKVIIQDEISLVRHELKIPNLANDIMQKEYSLWTQELTGEFIPPLSRVSDINYIVTDEIYRESNGRLHFDPPKKDDKEAAINNVRVMLENEKIMINPKCETLIRHLIHCKWKKSTNKNRVFSRSAENGHYDAVDALVYAIRNIQYNKNPYPKHYMLNLRENDMHVQNPDSYYSGSNNMNQLEVLKKIYRKKN